MSAISCDLIIARQSTERIPPSPFLDFLLGSLGDREDHRLGGEMVGLAVGARLEKRRTIVGADGVQSNAGSTPHRDDIIAVDIPGRCTEKSGANQDDARRHQKGGRKLRETSSGTATMPLSTCSPNVREKLDPNPAIRVPARPASEGHRAAAGPCHLRGGAPETHSTPCCTLR